MTNKRFQWVIMVLSLIPIKLTSLRVISSTVLSILFIGCTDQNSPSIIFSGEFVSTSPDSGFTENTYDPILERMFNPTVENIEKSTESQVYTGNDFKDIVSYEIKEDKGFLTVATTKQQIECIYKTYERVLTFAEGVYYDAYEIKHDGIYRIVSHDDNKYLILEVELNNFQLSNTYSILADKCTNNVSTVFKEYTSNPWNKQIIIGDAHEEYKLEFISDKEMFIQQTKPSYRGIGTLELN